MAEDTLAHRASVASPQPMDLATSLTLTNAEKSKRQTYRVLVKLVSDWLQGVTGPKKKGLRLGDQEKLI